MGGDGGPGYNDGELPTESAGALTRVTQFDVETRTATAQYAYPLDKVSSGPDGDNGLTDLVALDDENFLAIERGYGTHVAGPRLPVSVGDAEDVLARPSLTGAPVRTMTKTLLVDLTSTVDPLDNIEGITLGPKLSDGRRSLLLVSDDNFSPQQITQFLAFALASRAFRRAHDGPAHASARRRRNRERYLAVSGGGRVREKATQHADGLAERLPVRGIKPLQIRVDGRAAVQPHLPQGLDSLRV